MKMSRRRNFRHQTAPGNAPMAIPLPPSLSTKAVSKRRRLRSSPFSISSSPSFRSGSDIKYDDYSSSTLDECSFEKDDEVWSLRKQQQRRQEKLRIQSHPTTRKQMRKQHAHRHSNDISKTSTNHFSKGKGMTAATVTAMTIAPSTTTLSSYMKKRRPNIDFSNVILNCMISSPSLPHLLYQRQIHSSPLPWKSHKSYLPSCASSKHPFLIQNASSSSHPSNQQRQQQHQHHYQKRRRVKSRKRKSAMINGHPLPFLSSTNDANMNIDTYTKHKKQWKECMKRSIPFTHLNTPLTDAILALDGSGSYLIAVGDGATNNNHSHNSNHNNAAIVRELRNSNLDSNLAMGSFPSISLRFYAVPSPATLQLATMKDRKKHNKSQLLKVGTISPHVCTIPLMLESIDRIDHRDSNSSTLSTTLSVTNTRIQILLSRDGSIGVAFLHHSTGEDASSSIVLFNLPSFHCMSQQQQKNQRFIKIYRCPRIRIGGEGSRHTLRNLLWPTKIIPIGSNKKNIHTKSTTIQQQTLQYNHYEKEEEHLLCNSYRLTSYGYILFNDEDDGYRIFWIESESTKRTDNDDDIIYDRCSTTKTTTTSTTERMFNIRPARSDIVEQCFDTLEECQVDPMTGYTQIPRNNDTSRGYNHNKLNGSNCDGHVKVVFEAYLQVDALLSDVLHRRKNLIYRNINFGGGGDVVNHDTNNAEFHYMNIPDYYYNIVSFDSSNGRSLSLVVTFANPRHVGKDTISDDDRRTSPAAYAIFIEIDLFDQSYQERKWVVHPCKFDSIFLKEWSKTLAIHYRMVEMRLGPFCVKDEIMDKMKYCLHNFNDVTCYESNKNGGINDDNNEDENDFDHVNDTNMELWEPYVLEKLLLLSSSSSSSSSRKKEQNSMIEKKAPKRIAMSSLYNFCDVISNDAVVDRKPISKMKSRDFPLQVNYSTS